MIRFAFILLLALSWKPRVAYGGERSPVAWGAFVDSYYAYDFNRPPDFDRAYTTQPARHNEFNINLAYLEAKLTQERVRGRMALQVGTSVQSNYAGEPTKGQISGSTLSRHLQEGYVGYRIADQLWVDAGVYFSHIGLEGFISRDNWTYTRSLVADYSPYYQTGLRLSYQPSKELGFQLHLVNGWQKISENNGAKSVGTQISFSPFSRFSVTYNTLIGEESGLRHFHDLVLKIGITESWEAGLQADVGFQDEAWYGAALIQRLSVGSILALGGRVERYSDPDQIIVVTSAPEGFQTWSASANIDVQLDPKVLWRTELRGYWSKDQVFPAKDDVSDRDAIAVMSLAITI